MTVFPLEGGHTGDLLLALPAIGAARRAGPVVVTGLAPRYLDPLRLLPLQFRAPHPDDRPLRPAWRPMEHRTRAWLRALGGAEPVRMTVPLECAELARDLLSGPHVVLSPMASSRAKRWPPPCWGTVAAVLRAAGASVAWIGPPEVATEHIAEAAPGDTWLVGRDTPRTWPALIERAAVLVSPDSGAVHLADAIGVPVVGLYGFTRVEEFGPFWDPSDCLQAPDMREHEPRAVAEQVLRVLRRSRSGEPTQASKV